MELHDVWFCTCLPVVVQQLRQHKVGLVRLVARVTLLAACSDDGPGPDDLREEKDQSISNL
jgi:hypothetical protein